MLITVGSVMFLLFNVSRSLLFLVNGLFIFFMVLVRLFIFRVNAFCLCLVFLWCRKFNFFFFLVEVLNFYIILVIYGLEIIYRFSVVGFLVRFIVLSLFFIIAFFCLWVWLVVVVENLCVVFLIDYKIFF